jgi:hypothetical protein
VEVVTVLRPAPHWTRAQREFSFVDGHRLWWLTLLDLVAVAWMVAAGGWVDQHGGELTVVTLGGHHEAIIGLALVSFALLAAVAITSDGFITLSGVEMTIVTVAGLLTIVALAGLLAVVVAVVGIGLFVGLMARLLR